MFSTVKQMPNMKQNSKSTHQNNSKALKKIRRDKNRIYGISREINYRNAVNEYENKLLIINYNTLDIDELKCPCQLLREKYKH